MNKGEIKIQGTFMTLPVVTPIGLAKFSKLDQPDMKYDKADGIFSIDLVLDSETANTFRTELDAFEKQALAHYKLTTGMVNVPMAKSLLRKEINKDKQETGNFVVRAKAKAKFIKKVPVYLGRNKFEDRIPFGSKVQIKGTLASYFAPDKFGLSFRLSGVMIRELAPETVQTVEDMFGEDLVAEVEAQVPKNMELDL